MKYKGKSWLNFLIWAILSFLFCSFRSFRCVVRFVWHGCDDKHISKHASSASENSWLKTCYIYLSHLYHHHKPFIIPHYSCRWSWSTYTFVLKLLVEIQWCFAQHLEVQMASGSCLQDEPTWCPCIHMTFTGCLRFLVDSHGSFYPINKR